MEEQDNFDMENFVASNPELIEQFKVVDAKNITQPSILLTGGINELGLNKLTPHEVEQYLLMHPVIPRGIDIKSNRMTGRGYSVIPADESDRAKEAADRMAELLETSGGETLINSWIKDAYAFGNGYLTLLPSSNSNEIVYVSKEHPVFFRIARKKKKNKGNGVTYQRNTQTDFTDEYGEMKINAVTKKPEKYTQVVFTDSSKKQVEPIGNELDSDQVAHLVFDTWGDEAEGVGLVQYVHLLLKYLMNVEEAGAEATYRSGFTQKKVTTNIKSENDLRKLADNLKQINAADSMILPEGTDVENLIPGTTEFTEVHEVFMNLIAIRIGVPKPILTLDGTDTNKATMRELMKDLLYDIRADELKVSKTIEQQLFEPACESIFGEGFELIPTFTFNEFEEGKEERADVVDKTSQYVSRFTEAFIKLRDAGADEHAQMVLDYMVNNIPVNTLPDSPSEKKDKESIPVPPKKEEPKPQESSPVPPENQEDSSDE